jgi:hypothetical protein
MKIIWKWLVLVFATIGLITTFQDNSFLAALSSAFSLGLAIGFRMGEL